LPPWSLPAPNRQQECVCHCDLLPLKCPRAPPSCWYAAFPSKFVPDIAWWVYEGGELGDLGQRRTTSTGRTFRERIYMYIQLRIVNPAPSLNASPPLLSWFILVDSGVHTPQLHGFLIARYSCSIFLLASSPVNRGVVWWEREYLEGTALGRQLRVTSQSRANPASHPPSRDFSGLGCGGWGGSANWR